MRSNLHSQGFATEAATACREYVREHVDVTELIAIIHPDNGASERVAEKIGMNPVADDRGETIPVRTVLSMQLLKGPVLACRGPPTGTPGLFGSA